MNPASPAFLFLAAMLFCPWVTEAQTIAIPNQASDAPSELRCEYGVNPLGIDVSQPRLSWVLHRNWGQNGPGYRILVATSPDLLTKNQGDLWDSGWVASSATNQVNYGGNNLVSFQKCWWKVSDGAGWSEPAEWTMGVLSTTDWSGAKWIGAPEGQNAVDVKGPKEKYETILLRGEFTASPVKKAILALCGLGQNEVTLNGQRVSDDFLNPGWTLYTKTCLYNTYDVTRYINSGPNVLGILLGNGMYLSHRGRYIKGAWSFGPLQAMAVLHLECADGSIKNVITDENWKTHSGPITFSSIYGGEDYDARLEVKHWDQPDGVVSDWEKPAVLNGPGGDLQGYSCSNPPLKTFEVFQPAEVKESSINTRKVYDFGQNASMVVRLKVHGPAGSEVRMMPAELAGNNGSVNRSSVGGNVAWWKYTLAGRGEPEVYLSKFFYQGARYVQVDLAAPPGATELPTVESLESVVVHASCEPLGNFACSNNLFNRIYTLVRWAQRSNMVSVMSDCPARERLGWLEEDHLNGPALRYNFDLAQLFTKVCRDMMDSQRQDGLVPSTCPDYPHWGGDFADSPEWGSSCILVPWQSYQFLGDIDILSRNYQTMTRYVSFLKNKAHQDLLDYGLSDWYDIGPKGPGRSQLTPKQLSATAFYWEDVNLLAKIATLLKKSEEATAYAQQADEIKQALNAAQFHPDTNQYGEGSQCGNSLALVMGFVDPERRQAVLNNVVADLKTKGLTAGDVGYRYLIRALADGDRSDLLFTINNQSEKPGYGLQLKRGATSLTEAWDAGGGSSQNHFMLGQINEWFFHDLGGIQPDDSGPGFQKIIIKPAVVGDLSWVKSSYKSIRGLIVSNWSIAEGLIKLEVTIPYGSTATVYVPTKKATSVKIEGGTAKLLREEKAAAIYEIGSGTYQFTADALPAIPTGLRAEKKRKEIDLQWTTVPAAKSYTIRRSQDGIHFDLLTQGLTDNHYVDTTPTWDTSYTYRVCAGDEEEGAEVHVTLTNPGVVQNGNFQEPVVSGYLYTPPNGAGWVFDERSGITSLAGEMWQGNKDLPKETNQVAFLQMKGTISQDLTDLEAGKTYVVKFNSAQRASFSGEGQTWQVKVDDQVIGEYAPTREATSFVENTANFTAKGTKARLSFVGTNTRGGDNTIFLYDVRVLPQ